MIAVKSISMLLIVSGQYTIFSVWSKRMECTLKPPKANTDNSPSSLFNINWIRQRPLRVTTGYWRKLHKTKIVPIHWLSLRTTTIYNLAILLLWYKMWVITPYQSSGFVWRLAWKGEWWERLVVKLDRPFI